MDASIAKQEQLFRMHCELAAKFHKPLSVHSRGAEKRCLEIVSDYDVSAIFHSFTGSYKVASQIVQCGHYLGVNGIVTYDSADDLRNLYKRLMGKLVDPQPADFYDRQIVFETDSPFLFPFDSRKRNYPSQVSVVYNYLAQIITNYGHQ
jgi:TatD DNase family protein